MRLLYTFCALLFFSYTSFADSGYEISIKVDGLEENEIYLGYHYGDKQYIKDTVEKDSKGYFTFKGEESLDGGVYLVIMPPNNEFFHILIDETHQNFAIETKKEDLVANIRIKGSPDNQQFYDYLKYLSSKIPLQKELQEEKKAADNSSKLEEVQKKLKTLDQEVKKYHSDLINSAPKSMSALMVKPRMEIEMPEFEGDEKEVSLKRYKFYKKHYFDNLDLGDERLLRTPFLFERVKYYEEKLTPQHPDSIAQSLDYLLGKMQPSEETFKFYLIHYLNKYASSKVVGMDAVYVHLSENYYCKGLAPWTEEEQLEKICDDARRLKPVLIGTKARDITTNDRNDKPQKLFDIKSDYTVLYFWASDCGQCKKMTPYLIDFHEKYKDKGVSIFTICKPKSGDYGECWKYIDEHENMDKIINTYDPSHRAQIYYNVRSTPMLFILNKNKEIIMKGIGANQLEEVMGEIMKKEKAK